MSLQDIGLIPPEVISQWEKDKHPAFATTGSRKRSTYTLANATLFKPFFDRVIETNSPQALPWNCIHVRPKTLYVKVCDALKWLCENGSDSDKTRYLMLKATYKLEPQKGGIVLTHRNTKHGGIGGVDLSKLITSPEDLKSGITVIGRQVKQVDGQTLLQDVISWKEDLLNFINARDNYSSKPLEIKFDGGIDDKSREYIEGICAGINDVEYVYVGDTLKVCKVQI